MAHPSPELAELARRIVTREAGESSDSAGLVAAVEIACRRLKDHLAGLLGRAGAAALLGRSLHLAQRERPLLEGVAVSVEPTACFTGLAESLAGSSDEEATAAAASVFTHVLEVLVMLLGKELGMRPVRKLWPQETSVKETGE